MTSVASQRLIEASATLGPADRALLSLLVNHGLDDGAVARLTGATAPAIASQRESLVEQLSATLGLPPATVREAVEELTTSARGQAAATAPSAGDGNHVPDSAVAATEVGPGGASTDAPAPAASPASPASPAPAASSRARVSGRGALALVVAAVAIGAVLVVILSSGNAKHRVPAVSSPRTTAARPVPQPAVQSQQGALAGLAGGPAGVSGSVTIVGPPSSSRLHLIVSGLPSAGRSHYELWLYNSIIDAVPLALIGAPGANLGVPLPPDFHHYRWLDISLQPPGSVNNSGQSVARAAVPG